MLVFRFLQYWGRIGSENNMTSCHRPICRKEGVLLDYSTDGGTFQGVKAMPWSRFPNSIQCPSEKSLQNSPTCSANSGIHKEKAIHLALHFPYVWFLRCTKSTEEGTREKKKSHLKNKLQNGWIKKIITMLSRGLLIQLRNKFSCGFPSKR